MNEHITDIILLAIVPEPSTMTPINITCAVLSRVYNKREKDMTS